MNFLQLLAQYYTSDTEEARMHKNTLTFASTQPQCLERSLAIGHITTSAWITDLSRKYVLLTHHRKLDRWFQLGGHADGEPDLRKSAIKEATEESGLSRITLLDEYIFDIDIHLIPARRQEAAHYHYDIRFLMQADKAEPLIISPESKSLRWVPIEEVIQMNAESSIMRMVLKHKKLFGI